MNWYALIPLSAFILNFFLFSYVFAINNKSSVNRYFLLFAATSSLWQFTEFILWLPKIPDNVIILIHHIHVVLWLAPTILFCIFIYRLLHKPLSLWLKISIFFLIIFTLIGTFTDKIVSGFYRAYWGTVLISGPLFLPSIVICILIPGILCIILMIKSLIISKDIVIKKQLRLLLTGGTLSFVIALLVGVIITNLLKVYLLPDITSSSLVILCIFTMVAISKYSFLSVGIPQSAHALFSQVNDSVIIFNMDQNIVAINSQALNLLDIKEKEIKKLRTKDIFSQDYSFEENYINKEFELRVKENDLTILISQNFLKQSQIVTGKLVIIKDITEYKKIKEELHQSKKMQAVGHLAGGIAHDFNNQLTGILGYISLIKEELKDNSEISGYIEKILNSIDHSKDSISKLLAFARRGKIQSITIDIHLILKDIIEILKYSIDKKIKIILHLNTDKPYISGDPNQIQNALLNVAINAKDAMPYGGNLTFLTDIVSIDNIDYNKNLFQSEYNKYIKICISDTGTGMDEETKLHIFEPFFTTKNAGKGTGMGLAAVYGIIKSHKGIISVDSFLGRGTKFNIYFPAIEKKDTSSSQKSPHDKIITGRGNILFVDDEKIVYEMGSEILKRLGYTVSICKDGWEALEYYKKNWYDINLVILDLVMPKMSGLEAFTEMHKINPNINVLFSSGYSLNKNEEKFIYDKGLSFLQKPYNMSKLSQKVKELLGSK